MQKILIFVPSVNITWRNHNDITPKYNVNFTPSLRAVFLYLPLRCVAFEDK